MLLALLLSLLVPQAESRPEPAPWLPLRLGARWEYAGPDGKVAHVSECVAVTQIANETWYSIEQRRNHVRWTMLWSAQKDAVYSRDTEYGMEHVSKTRRHAA